MWALGSEGFRVREGFQGLGVSGFEGLVGFRL